MIISLLMSSAPAFCLQYECRSPDSSVLVRVQIGKSLTYSVFLDGIPVISKSSMSMLFRDGAFPGAHPEVVSSAITSVSNLIRPVVPEKQAVIINEYNQLVLEFGNHIDLVFRVYNNGAAYRFRTDLKEDLYIEEEHAVMRFAGPAHAYLPFEESFFSHNERSYTYTGLDTVSAGYLVSLPVLIETKNAYVILCESALYDYPGMWMQTEKGNTLSARFARYPLKEEMKKNSDRSMPVTEYAPYIARTRGKRSFPWRILGMARNEKELLLNQLVYILAKENRLADTRWIKPGKVAWDWWNANNITGVDFKSGINTETYKHYIDFASQYGIEYIILDEGWYTLGDVLDVVPEMDIEELVRYGNEKHVNVILWVVWKTLEDRLDEALAQYEKWGIAGIKVDFMQRDDQKMVRYYWNIAEKAAKHHLLVDFHGAYKPAGLRRAFPNVMTREGVKGLEHNKWSRDITPEHNLLLPFIRMVPGPMDYTPGAMDNAQPENFAIRFTRPMSMTTRAHQLAMYIVYESPLQMLADSPSQYRAEHECTAFIASVPTTWDETVVIDASIGDFCVLARRRGDSWFVGAMNDEHARNVRIGLSFLDEGTYSGAIIEDGINAHRNASDFNHENGFFSKNDTIDIHLAPGGGWAGRFEPGGNGSDEK